MNFSAVVNSGGVVQWSCSLSGCHLRRSRLSTSVCLTLVYHLLFMIT